MAATKSLQEKWEREKKVALLDVGCVCVSRLRKRCMSMSLGCFISASSMQLLQRDFFLAPCTKDAAGERMERRWSFILSFRHCKQWHKQHTVDVAVNGSFYSYCTLFFPLPSPFILGLHFLLSPLLHLDTLFFFFSSLSLSPCYSIGNRFTWTTGSLGDWSYWDKHQIEMGSASKSFRSDP